MLEEEVTEFLGRARSVRRSGSDRDAGYRNGHGRPRKLMSRLKALEPALAVLEATGGLSLTLVAALAAEEAPDPPRPC